MQNTNENVRRVAFDGESLALTRILTREMPNGICCDVCLCLLAGKVFLLRTRAYECVMCLSKRVFSLLQIYTAQF